MKIVIIGGGLIGVTTAYILRRRGHEVLVIERQQGAAQETSFANGGFLSCSMPEPWNAPGCWRVLLGSLARADAALKLRLKALPSLARWGHTFLRNSSRAAYERNTISNLRLAQHSMTVLRSLRQEAAIEYGGNARGALKIFRTSASLDQAVEEANRLRAEGVNLRRLTSQEIAKVEPALAPIADQLSGAIQYQGDEVGDAYQFCVALAQRAREIGVEFSFGSTVTALEMRSGEITAVCTNKGRLAGEHCVLAAGSYSPLLARSLGIDLPVRPAKGYSVSFEIPQGTRALEIPTVDDDLHAAIVPLGGVLRVAGTAEFTGFDLALRPERVGNLVELARRVLPRAGLDPAKARPWCGLRPMSADGVPIIGSTPIRNLWVSTGHGHLGWTMAAGSGELLADLMCGEAPHLDATPYALARFAA